MNKLLITFCIGFSVLGWAVGIFAIFGYYGFGDFGGEFGLIGSALLFFRFGLVASGLHFLSLVLAIVCFIREYLTAKKLHKLCIIGSILSVIYLIYYGILYIEIAGY